MYDSVERVEEEVRIELASQCGELRAYRGRLGTRGTRRGLHRVRYPRHRHIEPKAEQEKRRHQLRRRVHDGAVRDTLDHVGEQDP